MAVNYVEPPKYTEELYPLRDAVSAAQTAALADPDTYSARVGEAIKEAAAYGKDRTSYNQATDLLKLLVDIKGHEFEKERVLREIITQTSYLALTDKELAYDNLIFVARKATPGSKSDIAAAEQFRDYMDDRSDHNETGSINLRLDALRNAPKNSSLYAVARGGEPVKAIVVRSEEPVEAARNGALPPDVNHLERQTTRRIVTEEAVTAK